VQKKGNNHQREVDGHLEIWLLFNLE